MTFPDSSKKAPNVFFETFDSTGSPNAASQAATTTARISSPTPTPPQPVSIRWYDPPTSNSGNVNINNPTDVVVEFTPPPAPVADFSGTPLSGVAPLQVQFTDLSTNAPTAWSWEFENDGNVGSTSKNPIWVYSTPGTYSVKLTATNAGGSSTVTKLSYVVATVAPVVPVANFSGTPLTGIVPLTVQFTDLSSNTPTAWSWDFENDGTVDSSLQNPQHTYSSVGTYNVKLTASNNAGANSNTKTAYVTVSPVPPQATYLTTQIYPVDAIESALSSPTGVVSSQLYLSPGALAQSDGINIISGNLVQTFFPAFYTADPQSAQGQPISILSGNLVATFFPNLFTQYPEAAQGNSINILSGNLVQTYFPLAFTQPAEQAQAAPITIISGNLI